MPSLSMRGSGECVYIFFLPFSLRLFIFLLLSLDLIFPILFHFLYIYSLSEYLSRKIVKRMSFSHNDEVSTPLDPLNSTLSTPWTFLRPTVELHNAISGSAKYFFDSLAASVNESQSSRLHNNRKRKRSEARHDADQILQLKQLYVDGFTSDQIWEQAIRILDSTGKEIERGGGYARDSSLKAQVPSEHAGNSTPEIEVSELSDTDTSIEGQSDQSMASHYGDVHMDPGSEPEELSDDQLDTGNETGEVSDEDVAAIQPANESTHDTYTEDRFGLNDGFFSIDDFNAQTEAFEREDIKGGPTEEADSDEEDIDWHTNPLVFRPSKKSNGTEDDGISDSSDDDGPTFGNANLQADSDFEKDSDDDDNADVADGTGWIDTSDIKYTDFFAPPPRKVTSKKSRPLPKTQPEDMRDLGNDMDRAMADVRRDIFEGEASDEDEEFSDDNAGGSKNQHSTHEKQRTRIADEIRRLEAANVAKKEWMLSGEARAVERPMNSLIEEDLDFERVGKPVPVVTTETSESIEDLVKRRVLAKEFDEIIRRRPGTSDTQNTRMPRFELEDTKPQQSLAEMYETDHLRATDPNYIDPKNQKLAREHAEITKLWKEISSQLDTLSNWHYKPKTPQANINVITDAATITMEEARPSVSGAVNESAALAPQEIYTPGNDGKGTGEVILKTGASVAKDEMTREDKAKMRRKQKKQKKASAGHSNQPLGKTVEKQQVVSDLKKGGVKVIGKQGEVTDIHGSKVDATGMKNSGDTLKL